MKIIKKSIPVLLALAVILTDFSLKAWSAPSEDLTHIYYIYGQKYKEYTNRGIFNDNELARYISEIQALFGNEKTADEILDVLHTRKALLHEAKILGIYVTDQRFNEKLNELQTIIRQENDTISEILAFCAGAGISEEDYWRLSSPLFKEEWTINKLINTLLEQFMADNPDKGRRENMELFDKYYNNYVKELKQNYDKDNVKDDTSGEHSASYALRLLF